MNIYVHTCNFPVIFVRFELKLNFLGGFSKNIQIPNFMEIRPVEAELFYEGGRTDRHDETNNGF
jgi:hypothetical protein